MVTLPTWRNLLFHSRLNLISCIATKIAVALLSTLSTLQCVVLHHHQRNCERDRSGGRSDDGWEAPRVEILRGLIAAKIGIVDSQFCIKLTTSQKASQTIVSSFIDTDEATLTHSPTSVFPHTKHYRHHQMRTHSSLTQAIIPQLILRKLQIRRRYTMNDSNNDISTC